MRKSIVLFAAGFSLFSLTVACNDSSRNTEGTTNAVETTTDTGSEMTTMEHEDSKELENTDVVESGTYTGTAEVVDDAQKEIYVKLDDNRTIELYFSNDTELMQNGESVAFDALEKGQRLEVQVEKVNEQLNPQKVTILQ